MTARQFGALDLPTRLKCTLYTVEATDFERHALWCTWADDAREFGTGSPVADRVSWEQVAMSNLVTVAAPGGRPIAICLTWAIILGAPVMFWEATSKYVDHDKIDEWFADNCTSAPIHGRPARTNPTNFHNCVASLASRVQP